MIKSMTAFGRAKREGERSDITIEIKSVNSRYFDCTVKMPRSLIYLEERIKAYVQKNAISRGKVDVYVTVENHTQGVGSIEIDREYAKKYIDALRTLRDEFSLPDDFSTMSVARLSDIFITKANEEDVEGEWAELCAVLDLAIADYV